MKAWSPHPWTAREVRTETFDTSINIRLSKSWSYIDHHPLVFLNNYSRKTFFPKIIFCSPSSASFCGLNIRVWGIYFEGKLEVVKQEMARVNVDSLGISKRKWTGMGGFNSDDHCIYYCGQELLRRHGVGIIVNKRVRNAVLGRNLKNDRMISVCLQGKPFNITVIQVYAPTSNAEEAERFYEDLQDLFELTPKKDVLFIIGNWNVKVGSQKHLE